MTANLAERVVRLETKQDYTDKKLETIISKIDSLASCVKRDITKSDEKLETIINRRLEPIKKDLESLKFLIPMVKYPKLAGIILAGILALLGVNVFDGIKELFL